MTVDPILVSQVKRDEGGPFLTAYPDPLSPLAKWALQHTEAWWRGPVALSGAPWTDGYGNTHGVSRGTVITLAEAEEDIVQNLQIACALVASALPWAPAQLSPPRLRVLQNMMFNLGWDDPKTPAHEGLSGFTTFLGLVKADDYQGAADDGLKTLWARQVGQRATRRMAQLATGIDQ